MSARIFISYARADGSTASERLIKLLASNGHSAWQDLRELGSEETVWPQIETALKTAEFLIVLITPAALKSEYVRKEWREARRIGATILPVMAMEQSRSTLPRWLRRGEVYDLAEPAHREKFLARLNSTGGTFRADWDAGLEIETFIARPRLFAQIKAQLLSDTSEPLSLTSALQGRGGYGKSVLAGEVARDPEIRDAYIDGVFWVSLGQDNPDVLGQINHLIRRISGAGGAPDVNTAAEELRRLLEKRDVLIILDDVWRRQDLYPFAKATGQGNATLLATTRKLDALPPSAQTIDISGMEPDEAVALLSYELSPDAAEQRALSAFAADFWHWPQLLAIANGLLRGRLRDGDTLLRALETVADGARRGVVPGTDERERTIANVMQMGIDDLGPADRERFKALAVVSENTAIPVAILAPLWRLSQYEAEEFTRLLLDRRLIQSRDLSDPSVGARIRMHDDMLWYLGAITDEASKQALHSAILAAHRPVSGHWADLDQRKSALHYLWRHLLWHLDQAGKAGTATALCIEYAWVKAKLNLLGIDALLADYRLRPADRTAALIGKALELSSHALELDREQLGFQLFGRLNQLANDRLMRLCNAANDDIPFLEPRSLRFNSPGSELMRLRGHQRAILSVAFSPDGTRIVSGGADTTLHIWDAVSGEALGAPISGHKAAVWSVAFSQDGSRIVSGGRQELLRVWDATTGAELCGNINVYDDWHLCVAFSPDGSHVASGDCEGILRLWDTANGVLQGFPICAHMGSINCVAFSPDGNRIASGGEDGVVRIWDAHTRAALGEPLQAHEFGVTSVAFSADGKRIVSGGSMYGTLRLWDGTTGAALGEPFYGNRGRVRSIAFSPDSTRIFSGGYDGTIWVWNANTREALGAPFRGHEGEVLSLSVSPDGNYIVSGGDDGTLRLWDANYVASPSGHDGEVLSVAISPDGRRIVSGGNDGALRLWDPATGAALGEPVCGHADWVHSVVFFPDGSRIVSGGNDGMLHLWDAVTGTAIGKPLCGHSDDIYSVAISPDGDRILSLGSDGTLRLWDVNSSAELEFSLNGHHGEASSIAFSPDGSRIVSGSIDGKLHLWDTATWVPLGESVLGHEDEITCVAFSPDGSLIASGSIDGKLHLWNAATRESLGKPLCAHENWVNSVAFSPDGRFVISGGNDNHLRLWNASTAHLEAVFQLDTKVKSVAVSTSYVTIGDGLGNVHVLRWRAPQ